ncbi:MAG: cytochrome C, partial [Nitrospinaceae bacterium]|nr:cytochrome C [Nitrospinaceae bacterium]NIR53921.1 cytochrome C [Nitrospinaceae bacterium]NIT81142.1 cytochrome C [Nitrospinaceae bacterium]NIU95547.1 cytochrome C [Nitrospinaceae bacterium]NIW05015.1 cytochrome C [Nitrospinaceae bacterium]
MVGLVFVAMLYALLLAIPKPKAGEKSFFQNIKFKIPVVLVLSVIIWYAAGAFGFPIWWQIEFVTFALVGMFFFIILDLRPMQPETSTGSW